MVCRSTACQTWYRWLGLVNGGFRPATEQKYFALFRALAAYIHKHQKSCRPDLLEIVPRNSKGKSLEKLRTELPSIYRRVSEVDTCPQSRQTRDNVLISHLLHSQSHLRKKLCATTLQQSAALWLECFCNAFSLVSNGTIISLQDPFIQLDTE